MVRFLYGHSMSLEERATFRSTLRMLRNHFEFVSVPHAVELVRTPPASGRYLCFSFDDGFRDNHDVIAPTLADAGATACFFVATNLVTGSDEERQRILRDRLHTSPDRPTMTVPMLRELSRAGFTIGCHTRDEGGLDGGETIGPVLTGKRWQAEFLARFLANPAANSTMPIWVTIVPR